MNTEDEEAMTSILQDRLSRGYVIKTQRKKRLPVVIRTEKEGAVVVIRILKDFSYKKTKIIL